MSLLTLNLRKTYVPKPSESSVQLEVVSLQPGEYYIQYRKAILRMLEEYIALTNNCYNA